MMFYWAAALSAIGYFVAGRMIFNMMRKLSDGRRTTPTYVLKTEDSEGDSYWILGASAKFSLSFYLFTIIVAPNIPFAIFMIPWLWLRVILLIISTIGMFSFMTVIGKHVQYGTENENDPEQITLNYLMYVEKAGPENILINILAVPVGLCVYWITAFFFSDFTRIGVFMSLGAIFMASMVVIGKIRNHSMLTSGKYCPTCTNKLDKITGSEDLTCSRCGQTWQPN